MTPAGIRSYSIDGKAVHVLDGMFPEGSYREFCHEAERANYRRLETAMEETKDCKHWSIDFEPAFFRNTDIFAPIEGAMRDLFAGEAFKLHRTYVNLSTFGDWLIVHRDCAPDRRDVTALVFLCDQWQVDWAGETIFVDDAGDIGAAVAMRPQRLVLFRGAILHAGRPPARGCFKPRLTLALKFAAT